MADDRNIQDFNRGVALVLVKLYSTFPAPIDLRARDLDEAADETAREVYHSTINFLRDEGLLRFQTVTGDVNCEAVFVGAVLTAKGLSILQSPAPRIIDLPARHV